MDGHSEGLYDLVLRGLGARGDLRLGEVNRTRQRHNKNYNIYESKAIITEHNRQTMTRVIITKEMFEEKRNRFVEWKRVTGFKTYPSSAAQRTGTITENDSHITRTHCAVNDGTL